MCRYTAKSLPMPVKTRIRLLPSTGTNQGHHRFLLKSLEAKISVVTEDCSLLTRLPQKKKQAVITKYNLPRNFGSSIVEQKKPAHLRSRRKERRNGIPLVVIGMATIIFRSKNLCCWKQPAAKIIFLSETAAAKQQGIQNSQDFPAIYQSAAAMMIY